MKTVTNNEIKEIRSLRDKKYRDASGLFVVEGEKMVSEALESGLEIKALYRRDEVGDKVMERISSQSSPSPVLAVVRKPFPKEPTTGGLCLALDAVRDPGNLGTIMRIADWFGIDGIYASEDTVEAFNPKVIQASMGAVFRRQVHYCRLPEICRRFKAAGLQVFGTFLEGEDIYDAELPSEGLIIMGNEADGVSPDLAAEASRRLTIPSFAKGRGAESLNVAVATAVTVSEFKRRFQGCK